ncbi:hypothetical protein XM38_011840 [Halomicronema hongdechloris C2206]|uniref:Uncharacterized protein n=1 Tax=Halomicronema hongdechloris C2206 TaxID=1641165 RepID=A0A1Z3HIX1_9CYAN|nr:hypothetical protein [Halomicronema hongdechloris]ASC70248.1 hypothetical protein XM38_011840 [Halomicronema hongdechloris C2206]
MSCSGGSGGCGGFGGCGFTTGGGSYGKSTSTSQSDHVVYQPAAVIFGWTVLLLLFLGGLAIAASAETLPPQQPHSSQMRS